MSRFIFILLFSLSDVTFAFDIKVVTRENLTFQAQSVESSSRLQESFSMGATDTKFENLIVTTVQEVVKLLPSKYLPPLITINIEDGGTFTDTRGQSERIPLSVLLSTQIPGKNEIRFCDHEIRNNPEAVRTILAHEMGHMIIEWAWRSTGAVPPNQLFGWLWEKSIYEGVADYISATVNNTTLIGGGSDIWYGRDIFKFNTIEQAQKQTLLKTLGEVRNGLVVEGLVPRYRTYTKLIEDMETELKVAPDTADPNAEGAWIAGQLWLMNQIYGSKSVINSILELALSGKKFQDSQEFLSEISSKLTSM